MSTSLVLTPINGEPRVHDLHLADRLGFDRPRKIRDIIKRNHDKLLKFGDCPTVGRCIEFGNQVQDYLVMPIKISNLFFLAVAKPRKKRRKIAELT